MKRVMNKDGVHSETMSHTLPHDEASSNAFLSWLTLTLGRVGTSRENTPFVRVQSVCQPAAHELRL
jgi:hypothetical protein